MKPEKEKSDDTLEEEEAEEEKEDWDDVLRRYGIPKDFYPRYDTYYYGLPPFQEDTEYASGADPYRALVDKLDEAPWSDFRPKKRRKPSTRKPTEKAKKSKRGFGGGKSTTGRPRRSGRSETTELNPPPGGVSSLDLVNTRIKPSKRGKTKTSRPTGKGIPKEALFWDGMDKYEQEDYIASLHRKPLSEVEPILNKLPDDAFNAYYREGQKRDDGSENYGFYDDEWTPKGSNDPGDESDYDELDDDNDAQVEDSDTDDDEKSAEEESEPDADETMDEPEDDTQDRNTDDDGDDERPEVDETEENVSDEETSGDEVDDEDGLDEENTDDAQQESDYQESDSQDSYEHESESSNVWEMDESESEHSADDDYDQNFHEAWGEADTEGADHADVVDHADVDVTAADVDTHSHDMDADMDVDVSFTGDMDWDVDVDFDFGDLDIDYE